MQKSAREAWKEELNRGTESVTTYNGLHAEKVLDEPTQGRVRPTSPTRQNKPHPPKLVKSLTIHPIQLFAANTGQ